MAQNYPDFPYLARLALRAGDLMRNNFQLNVACEWKSDNTPLTATDTAINNLVMEAVTKDFPHIQAVGEEGKNETQQSEYVIIFDPVDGTMCFSTGMPVCTFCIAVIKDGIPISGIIYDPFQNRLWHA